LKQRCRTMAEQLIRIKNAPKLESYTGPVLFDAQPAASVFSQRFARRFTGGQRSVGGRSSPDDFEKKLNKRVLPRFLNVVDDPTRETVAGEAVMGHYAYDDQGVEARPVKLVEDGRLHALVMSRNPSKEFKESTGHGRGQYRPRASVGCLVVTPTTDADAASLREELLEACQDEDLEYGMRVASLGSAGAGGGGRYSRFADALDFMGYSSRGGTAPLAMYKVYPDGKEELVRGAQIAQISLKAFKRVLAAGDKPYVLNTGGVSGGRTVVAPALLFEELDLTEIDQDFDKPPIIPNPLVRESDR
jgi:TldD protein